MQRLVLFGILVLAVTSAHRSAMDVALDTYHTCLKDLRVHCVKPKALEWMNVVANDAVIHITEDLLIIKKQSLPEDEERSNGQNDVFDAFEDFLQTHELVAKVPEVLRLDGPLANLVPRTFHPEQLSVPLAATGRSRVVKKIIVPFLLGLKFKAAVLVPLALTLIALKTWKALTLGLLSMVLTAAMLIFKFTKPKVVNYEVIHYPHHDHHEHHFDHHDHHIDHSPVSSGWGRQSTAQEIAYNAYVD